MISEDFEIDFENKKIIYVAKVSGREFSVRELYSYLQDVFNEAGNMKYDIPIEAESKTKYFLVNGWTIDVKARKRLKGGSLEVIDRPGSPRFTVTVVKPDKPRKNPLNAPKLPMVPKGY